MKSALLLALALLGGLAAITMTPSAAGAIDCAAANTVSEKAICASPETIKADAAMASAYEALLAQSTASEKPSLISNQSIWIDQRDADCDTDEASNPANPADLKACLIKEADDRRRLLAGLPDEGPGATSKIVPVIEQGADGSFIVTLRFAHPASSGENLVNAVIDGELQQAHVAQTSDDFTDSLWSTLSYASPTLLSVNVFGAHVGPKYAHPLSFNYNLNIDMTTGKRLSFADAFPASALPGLQQQCIAQIGDYLTAPDDSIGNTVARVSAQIADLEQWRFGAGQATITFDPDDEDPAVCHLPYADLRKLINPGFPLPM